jgi:HlyD family secretion protein
MNPGNRRFIVISALGLVVALGLAWSFWPRPVDVEMGRVTRGAMRVEVSDEGRTRVREIYQVTPPVDGRLLRIEVHPGDRVVGGQTALAYLLPTAPSFLDSRTRAQAESGVKAAAAARSLAAAEVTRARAELDFAQSDLRRTDNLLKSNAISRASFDHARLARDVAAAQLATAQAGLRAREFDLETARAVLIDPTGTEQRQKGVPLRAPVTGRVLRVLHENEGVLAAGTPILEIGDPNQLEIVADFISEDAVRVHPGDMARITDWGGEETLNARVRLVEPSGFTKVSALGIEEQRVNILLDPAPPLRAWTKLADAFRITVHIGVWHTPSALRLPVSAMFRRGDGWAVFAVRQGHARLVPVKVGHANDEEAEVLGGIAAGENVILHPSDRIADGTRVAGGAR